jgi:DNA repair protein RadC
MELNRSIKTWAEDDRPREKMLLKGKHALSDAELIAILLGSGTPTRSALDVAQDVLQNSKNNLFLFGKLNVNELRKIKGIGVAKAVTLCAAIELGKRRQAVGKTERIKITSAQIAYKTLKYDFQDLAHEEFYVLYLNRGNYVLHKQQISKGGIAGTVVDGKIIFKTALDVNATGIVLAHNHPSGRLFPSECDKRITRQLKEFGKLIEIEVLDHLIVSDTGYFSFVEKGLL